MNERRPSRLDEHCVRPIEGLVGGSMFDEQLE